MQYDENDLMHASKLTSGQVSLSYRINKKNPKKSNEIENSKNS